MLGTFTKCFLLSFLIEVTQTYIPSFSTQKKEPLNQGILKLLVERIRLYSNQYTETEY